MAHKGLTEALALAGLGLTSPAAAQSYGCTPPRQVPAAQPVARDGPSLHAAIAGYTLALSWSPEFCHGAGGRDRANAGQCGGRVARFGFIVHGLWPEAARGAPPQWCAASPPPSPDLLRRNFCMTPSVQLQVHEWAKHGTCMARRPEGYFKVASILWRALRMPDADALSRRDGLTVGELRSAFAAANAGWDPRAVGVLVGQGGWLRELRLCYSRRFMPTPCPRGRSGPPDSARLRIWRGL